jgi:hypothetical protein
MNAKPTPPTPYVHRATLYDITGGIAQAARMIEEVLESTDLDDSAKDQAINYASLDDLMDRITLVLLQTERITP